MLQYVHNELERDTQYTSGVCLVSMPPRIECRAPML